MKLLTNNIDIENIIKDYQSGKSVSEIAREFKCSKSPIQRILKEKGVFIPDTSKGLMLPNTIQILNMFDNGDSCNKIARYFNVDGGVIVRIVKKSGRKVFSKIEVNNRAISNIDNIVKLYKDGKTIKEIGDIFNIKSDTIYKNLKRFGIEIKRSKYDVNHNYFDIIDTPNKAYCLGFICADGCNKVNTMTIITMESDIKILQDIARQLNFDGKLHFIKRSTLNRKDLYRLEIYSPQICKSLNTLGCIPNKSLTLKFPTFDQVPENLIRHFIRGYFDGDGSIATNSESLKYVNVVSSKLFINGLDEYMKKLGIISTNAYVGQSEHTLHLFYTKQAEGKKFLNLIYGGLISEDLRLDRKYQKALPFLTS